MTNLCVNYGCDQPLENGQALMEILNEPPVLYNKSHFNGLNQLPRVSQNIYLNNCGIYCDRFVVARPRKFC